MEIFFASQSNPFARRSTIARRLFAMAILLSVLQFSLVQACPFCARLGKTLSDFIDEADGVFVCSFDANHWIVAETLKKPTGKATELTLESLSAGKASGPQMLIFAKHRGDRLTPFRTITIRGPELVRYLRETGKLTGNEKSARVRWYFNHLNCNDSLVADDAYKSLSKLYAAEIQAVSASLDRKKLRDWILATDMSSSRVGLFGLLLGLCGDAQDLPFLIQLSERPDLDRRYSEAKAGFLGGVMALDFDLGVKLSLRLLTDKSRNEATRRSALNALQFALAELPRTDPVPIFAKMESAIEYSDIGPLVIDEMRKAGYTASARRIFDLAENNKSESLRAAAVRFALAFPGERSQRLLASVKKSQPKLIRESEQLMQFEKEIQIRAPRLRPAKGRTPQQL